MLQTWVNQSAAVQAATGWNGDNFTYYENGNDYLFTWNLQWAGSTDANEFASVFHDMVNAAGAASTGVDSWYANGRYLTITLNSSQNSTLIACSTVQAATESAYFSFP
jgi:hypothetical protein